MARQPHNNTPDNTARAKTLPLRRSRGSRAQLGVQLLLDLQSSLNPTELIERFYSHVEELLGLTGIHANLRDPACDVQIGRRGRARVEFRLRHGDELIGTVTAMRPSAFGDADIARLEELIGLLQFPLRNAVLYQRALEAARKDPLTGLFNRTALDETVARELALAQRHGQPFSLIAVDVDNFKAINDRFGHQLGDTVLTELAEVLQSCARSGDLVFRLGGDEFIVASSHTDIKGARALAERIRNKVAERIITYDGEPVVTRISLGVAEAHAEDEPDQVVERADKALYRAKHAGRDQVVTAVSA